MDSKLQYIPYLVDQLLLEQGEYLPLELLLLEGCLSYVDYEAWRNGKRDLLDTALFGDPKYIKQQLMQAADYLQRRGWQADMVSYHAWQHDISRLLTFSQDGTLDHCFHQRYRKPSDQAQLDLFTDAPVTNRVNGIIRALANWHIDEARCQLAGLGDIAPDHIRFSDLEQLVAAAERLNAPVDDVAADLRILHQLQNKRSTQADHMVLRVQLKQQDSVLFHHYLKHVRKGG